MTELSIILRSSEMCLLEMLLRKVSKKLGFTIKLDSCTLFDDWLKIHDGHSSFVVAAPRLWNELPLD